MECPKCGSEFETVMFRDVEVDRCTGCKGIWFDVAEDLLLKEMVASELIDTGSVSVGKVWDEMNKIDCPRCQRTMMSLEDPAASNVRYEICTQCYGCFLDAGEFVQMKELNLGETLGQLIQSLKAS